MKENHRTSKRKTTGKQTSVHILIHTCTCLCRPLILTLRAKKTKHLFMYIHTYIHIYIFFFSFFLFVVLLANILSSILRTFPYQIPSQDHPPTLAIRSLDSFTNEYFDACQKQPLVVVVIFNVNRIVRGK